MKEKGALETRAKGLVAELEDLKCVGREVKL